MLFMMYNNERHSEVKWELYYPHKIGTKEGEVKVLKLQNNQRESTLKSFRKQVIRQKCCVAAIAPHMY